MCGLPLMDCLATNYVIKIYKKKRFSRNNVASGSCDLIRVQIGNNSGQVNNESQIVCFSSYRNKLKINSLMTCHERFSQLKQSHRCFCQ
jgi:hypothetical protein